MGLHDGAVDDSALWQIRRGQGCKALFPDALVGPAVKAIVQGVPRLAFIRSLAPGCTCLQNVDNAAVHTPIINTAKSPLVDR